MRGSKKFSKRLGGVLRSKVLTKFFFLVLFFSHQLILQRGGEGFVPVSGPPATRVKLGDKCIQNFHLGRYIVG